METKWTCAVSGLDEAGSPTGSPPESLSIGTKFSLACEGPAASLNKDKLSLEVSKENQFALRLLETKSLSDTSAEFVATSWKSGEVKLQNPILTDGSSRVALGDIRFTVTSVLKDEKQEPYPPWGPLALSWPIWVWISALVFFGLLFFLIWGRVRYAVRRKKLLKALEKNPLAIEPYHQFNKDLRRLARQVPALSSAWNENDRRAYLDEIDQALRWYIARTLVVPVLDQPKHEVIRDLNRKHKKLLKDLRREFTVTLTELDRARREPARMTVEDAHQIAELARNLVDRMREREEEKR